MSSFNAIAGDQDASLFAAAFQLMVDRYIGVRRFDDGEGRAPYMSAQMYDENGDVTQDNAVTIADHPSEYHAAAVAVIVLAATYPPAPALKGAE